LDWTLADFPGNNNTEQTLDFDARWPIHW
jgi:hypothetical protein